MKTTHKVIHSTYPFFQCDHRYSGDRLEGDSSCLKSGTGPVGLLLQSDTSLARYLGSSRVANRKERMAEAMHVSSMHGCSRPLYPLSSQTH